MPVKKHEQTAVKAPLKIDLKRLTAIQAAPLGVTVIKKGEPTPAASDLPVEGVPAYGRELKDPKDHQTVADRLDYLCAALGGAHYYRQPLDNGQVQLSVKLPDGTVLAGVDDNTAAAFNQLLDKVQRFMSAGLHKQEGK